MPEGKGEDLIGQILTTQHQRSHRGFWGWNSNAWDASASSPSPFPSPTPTPPGRASSQAICRSKNVLGGKYRHKTLDAFLLAKGKEGEGFIKPNWRGRVLRLNILCYRKTYKKNIERLFFFLYGLMPACRLGMHALQEKNKRLKPGLGHVL